MKKLSHLIFLLLVTTVLCSCQGKRGDRDQHGLPPVVPGQADALLTSFNPLQGTHVPQVTYLQFQNGIILSVSFNNVPTVTSPLSSFQATPLGQNLIGGLFQNGDPFKDLFLQFTTLQGSNTIFYELDLTDQGAQLVGFETLRIDNNPPTRLGVTFTVQNR